MKKFILKESEKEEILKKHLEFKNILDRKKNLVSEQSQKLTGDALIEKAIEVCDKLKSGTIKPLKGKDDKGNMVNEKCIKLVATSDNLPKYLKDDILVFKNNMTYDVYDGKKAVNNNWEKKGTYSWACKNLTTAQQPIAPTPPEPPKPSQDVQYLGGYTATKPKDYDLNPNNYDTRTIGGVLYYRNKTQSSYVNPEKEKYENQDQKDYIESLTTAKYTINPLVSQRSGLVKINFETVDSESKNLFPQGLTAYINRSEFTKDDRKCKKLIDDYWEEYLVGLPYKEGAIKFNMDKAKVQYCVSSHPDNKWPGLGTLGIGGGEKDLSKKINVLRGSSSELFKGKGYPQGEDKVFKLK
jgi:hypothetical protein